MEQGTAQAFAENQPLGLVALRLGRTPAAKAAPPRADASVARLLLAALARTRFLQTVVRALRTPVTATRDLPSPLLLTVFLTIPKAFLLPGVRCLGAGGGGPPCGRNDSRKAQA